MADRILITGASGFIGSHVTSALVEKGLNVTAIIRKESRSRAAIPPSAEVIPFDLSQYAQIVPLLDKYSFDKIVHIGAVRGGRTEPESVYTAVNVEATKVLSELSLARRIPFVYCSSVGVFGAIPKELPPTEKTPRRYDNFYHRTKIMAEEHLVNLAQKGLKYTIIRPSITYGTGDFGFPYTLVRLVDEKKFFLSYPPIKIGLADIQTVVDAFIRATLSDSPRCRAYTICDSQPVYLHELVDFIHRHLYGTPYPRWKTIPGFIFNIISSISGMVFRNDLWKARMELISRNWYYNSEPAVNDFNLTTHTTIPAFRKVIDWYKTTCPERSSLWLSR